MLRSFLPEITRTTGGYPVGITTLAGRPGHGKTTLAEQEAVFNASQGRSVVFASLEMSPDDLFLRMALRTSAINPGAAKRKGGLTQDDAAELVKSAAALDAMPIYVCDHSRGGRTWDAVRSSLDRTVDNVEMGGDDVSLVIIDHLAKFNLDPRLRPDMAYEVIVQGIDQWAYRRGVPVLLLHQLNRALERDQGRPGTDGVRTKGRLPRSSDLRECGSLEQDACTVMFVWLPSRFDPDSAERVIGHPCEKAKLVVTKARFGTPAVVDIWWHEVKAGFQPPLPSTLKRIAGRL